MSLEGFYVQTLILEQVNVLFVVPFDLKKGFRP